MSLLDLREDALLEDEQVWRSLADVAGSIVREANRTDAKIGITWRRQPDGIRITSRGAPAVALEVGTSQQPARRNVKRALDLHETTA